MAVDRKDFLENFTNETRESLETLGDICIALRKEPENGDKLAELLRILHSIKGASRMMKFPTIEGIAHGLEDIFKGVRDKRYKINKAMVQLVLSGISYLEISLKKASESDNDEINIKALLDVINKAKSGLPFSLENLKADEEQKTGAKSGGDSNTDTHANQKEYDSVRIKVSKVDEIIKKLNTLIIQQFQFKKENESIQDLGENLREMRNKLHHMAEKHPEVKELEKYTLEGQKTVQKLIKSYSEEMVQLEHTSFELQELILGLRMLPLKLVLGPLKKMVEETALALGKEINFVTSGTDLLLDKTILEQINDPIIHIIRNCIDHGIEEENERKTAGKPKQGSIEIKCASESGRINLRISDDGRGLDYEAIRQKALQLFPETKDEILEMDEMALSSFLFHSGFTTRSKITSLSGRGVGLNIVKHNIENIKGKITLTSEKGKGTTFILSLPLSLATVDGFFVSSQNEKFLIPSAFVREILNVGKEEIIPMLNRNVIRVRDQIIPVYPLSALLDKEVVSTKDRFSVIVVENLGDRIGISVDSVIQFSSLIYKPLPGNLIKLKAIQGIVFDENFNIINILYIPDIINRFKGIRNIEFRKRFSTRDKEYKQILVVDDSLSTREIEKSILELDGYNVELAVDGIDALEKLRERYFHLIVTDIKMPRMDGLTLIENVRRQEKFADTPIIVVSSEEKEGMASRLEKAGANATFNKRDFDRGSILQKVKELIG